MTYRDDVSALEARHAALEAEVAERARARDEVAGMLAEARARREAEDRLADLAAVAPARRSSHRIRIAIAAVVVALFGMAVVYRISRSDRDRMEEALAQWAVFTDQMCGCSTPECVDRVSDAMMKWADSMPKEKQSVVRLDEAQKQRLHDLARRMGECMAKARAEQPPAESPPAESPPAESPPAEAAQ